MSEKQQQTSPLKAIRDFCKFDCCLVGEGNDGATESWRDCDIEMCSLNPFRMGKNPFRKRRELTDEQRQEISDRLQKAREDNIEEEGNE